VDKTTITIYTIFVSDLLLSRLKNGGIATMCTADIRRDDEQVYEQVFPRFFGNADAWTQSTMLNMSKRDVT